MHSCTHTAASHLACTQTRVAARGAWDTQAAIAAANGTDGPQSGPPMRKSKKARQMEKAEQARKDAEAKKVKEEASARWKAESAQFREAMKNNRLIAQVRPDIRSVHISLSYYTGLRTRSPRLITRSILNCCYCKRFFVFVRTNQCRRRRMGHLSLRSTLGRRRNNRLRTVRTHC